MELEQRTLEIEKKQPEPNECGEGCEKQTELDKDEVLFREKEDEKAAWWMSAGSGVFMGMWAVMWHLLTILYNVRPRSWLFFFAVLGALVFAVEGMSLTDYLVDTKIWIYTRKLSWSGLAFFAELAIANRMGDAVALMAGAVVLLAAGIWLKVKKYL